MVDVPGTANLPDDVLPPLAAILIMLSGVAALIVSLWAAVGFVIHSRRTARFASDSEPGKSVEAVFEPC